MFFDQKKNSSIFIIDTTKPTILTDVFQNYAYDCVNVQYGTQMGSSCISRQWENNEYRRE